MRHSKQLSSPPQKPSSATERRRVAKIVHDERGTASVRWGNDPTDLERQKLELSEPLTLHNARTYNPYGTAWIRDPETPRNKRKDMRKLAEWIRMVRGLNERKGEDDSDD